MSNCLLLSPEMKKDLLLCRAIVETPEGSRGKFDYEPDSGLFRLAGMLPAGMAFPLDFGFVPGTLAEDGDPIDVLILSETKLPVGCQVEVRLLGLIEAQQTEASGGQRTSGRNDRIVARLSESRAYANVESLDQLGDGFVAELSTFFETYNRLKGKTFKVLGIGSPEAAMSAIEEGLVE